MDATDTDLSAHARALASEGASKGGQARAAKMSPEERSAAAKLAVEARWARTKGLAVATHFGNLTIGDIVIPCAVLSDGRRVLTETGLQAGIGMSAGGAKDGLRPLARFATVMGDRGRPIPALAERAETPIGFLMPNGGRPARGYEATLLAEICEGVLDARATGLLTGQQLHVAERCEQLMRGFARVGIISLVDEATGYQFDRARDELQRILAAYIAEELRPWVAMFPHEFFKQVYRIHGWDYREGCSQHPQYVGKLINKYIYDQLPPGVHDELRRRNPSVNGRRKHKHHQLLTEQTGVAHLDRQIAVVTMLLRISDNKYAYTVNFQKAFPTAGEQILLDLPREQEPKG